MITTADLALAAAAGWAVLGPALAWALTRAFYVGRAQDRDRLIARMEGDLLAAKAVILAAENAGFIQADRPRGRHEATPAAATTEGCEDQ